MKFSIRLNNDLTVSEYVELAELAEKYKFDQFWVSNDLFLRSAPVILTSVALATKSIEIGTCILNPYTIHPSEIAMMATTLDEVSNGRFNLGISSGANEFLEWVGIRPKKPRTELVEIVAGLRKLFDGETTEIKDWSKEAYLRFKPKRQIPIYIGAMSPNMLRAIGEYADGGLPLLFPPEHYPNVLPYIKEGSDKSNRDLADIDVAACIWCSIAEDLTTAEDPLREKIAYYGYAFSPMILGNLGLTKDDFAEIEQALMREQDTEKAKSLVTDNMLNIGITGTPTDIIKRLENLVDLGANHLSFGPPIGPDIAEGIRLIGETIIPHFQE